MRGFIDTPMDLFENGVKRSPGNIHEGPTGNYKILNLGSGNARFPEGNLIRNLDRPDWEAPLLEFEDGSVAAVHMYHFLEHLDVDMVRAQLLEVERVLCVHGVANIVVPHAMSPLAYQAPDHRSFWTEEGWQDMFYSAGYDSAYGHKWQMDISFMMVAGVKWSDLCVMLQLVKTDPSFLTDTPWRRS